MAMWNLMYRLTLHFCSTCGELLCQRGKQVSVSRCLRIIFGLQLTPFLPIKSHSSTSCLAAKKEDELSSLQRFGSTWIETLCTGRLICQSCNTLQLQIHLMDRNKICTICCSRTSSIYMVLKVQYRIRKEKYPLLLRKSIGNWVTSLSVETIFSQKHCQTHNGPRN